MSPLPVSEEPSAEQTLPALAEPSVATDAMGRFTTFKAYAEYYAGETGFTGPHGTFIRACAAADQSIAQLRRELSESRAALAARQYDDEDMKKLGAWVQANLQHHAGLSWSEGIAREFDGLRAALAEAQQERDGLAAMVENLSDALAADPAKYAAFIRSKEGK